MSGKSLLGFSEFLLLAAADGSLSGRMEKRGKGRRDLRTEWAEGLI